MHADSLFEDSRIVQICPETIKLLKGTQLQQEVTLESLLAELRPETAEEIPPQPQDPQPAPPPEPPKAEETEAKQQGNVFYDFGSLQEDSADFMMDEQLLAGPDADLMELIPASNTLSIQSASVCDPLILLTLSDGRALILEGEKDSKTLTLLETAVDCLFAAPDHETGLQISAACLYSDLNLWLNEGRGSALYKKPIFCIACRLNGQLEIYVLPHMTCIVSFPGFPIGWKIVDKSVTENLNLNSCPRVIEIRMECFSDSSAKRTSLISRPVLFALLEDGSLLAYIAFWTESSALAFRRLEVDYAGDAAWSSIRQHEKLLPVLRPRMVRFCDLGERHPCNGIFLCGMAPVFFILSSKGLFVHRLLVDGSVASMTPFSNVNCPKGFILAMTSDQLKICTLHEDRLDAPWPCSKVPLRCTPNKLAWYPDARLYMMLASRIIPFRERLVEEEGGDTHASAAYAANMQAAKEKGTEEGHEVKSALYGNHKQIFSRSGLWCLEAGLQFGTLVCSRMKSAWHSSPSD